MMRNFREKTPGLLDDILPQLEHKRQEIINDDIATPAQRERLKLEVSRLRDDIISYFARFDIEVDTKQMLDVDDIVFTQRPREERREAIFHPAMSLITIYVDPEDVDNWIAIVLHELIHSISRMSAYVLSNGTTDGVYLVGKSGLGVIHMHDNRSLDYFGALNEAITAMIEEYTIEDMTSDGSYPYEKKILLFIIDTMSTTLDIDKIYIYREFLYSYINGFSIQLKTWLLAVYGPGIMKVLAHLQEFSNYNFSNKKTSTTFTKLVEYMKGSNDVDLKKVTEWLIAQHMDAHASK